MSEARQNIENRRSEVVGYSKDGVIFSQENDQRLGEFNQFKIFDSDGVAIGYLDGPTVHSSGEGPVGMISSSNYHLKDSKNKNGFAIIVDDDVVGYYRGFQKMSAAAGLLIFYDTLCGINS